MNKLSYFFIIIFKFSYFLIGIFCLFAMIKGLNIWLGLGTVFSPIISIFVVYIPILRDIITYYGMVEGWGWDKMTSFIILAFPYLIFLIATGINYFNKDKVK